MPLWNIYHTPDIFDSQEIRDQLAKDITKLYTNGGLPAFYVVVQFIPLPAGHVFVAGEARGRSDKNSNNKKPFVRLVVQHMAVHRHEGPGDFAARFSESINTALRPFIADKGYDWEITVSDTPRDFWRFNGIAPPPWRSEAEKVWARDGVPTEWA